MKSHLEENKEKIVILEVREENNREMLMKQEDMIKELHKKVKYLELEKKPRYEELGTSATPIVLVSSFGHDQSTSMEEDIVEHQME